MSEQILRLGVPKGSLQEATIKLFEKAGWRIKLHNRNYFPDIDDDRIKCSLARAQEMSMYVENGTFDVGLTGMDWIKENKSDVVVVDDLIYSKVSNRKARWVLCVKGDSPYKRPEDLDGKKISTELVGFTKEYFQSRASTWTCPFPGAPPRPRWSRGCATASWRSPRPAPPSGPTAFGSSPS